MGAPIKGPAWSTGQFDGLKLPSGKTIAETGNEELRRELGRVGVPSAHSDGRDVLCRRYNDLVSKIHTEAGDAAVAAFLESQTMLEYFTNVIRNEQLPKHHRIDVHALKIGKKAAYDMPLSELYAELQKKGCSRIKPDMARPELLICYGVWLDERAEAAAT